MNASEMERLGQGLELRADGVYINRPSEDGEEGQEWMTRRLWQKNRNDLWRGRQTHASLGALAPTKENTLIKQTPHV